MTGAARGQGRSHCVRLARAGADVVAIDACAPVAEHSGYLPRAAEDLGETVNLLEGEGQFGNRVNSVHPYGTDTPMGNDLSMSHVFQDHPHYIRSFSPGTLPTESLAAPDLVSDIVVWLAGDASSLVTAAQIPTVKGYLEI